MSVNVDIIVLINALSAVVAIQSNIASLVFLGQLCIAYLYRAPPVLIEKNTLQDAKCFRLYSAVQQRINV